MFIKNIDNTDAYRENMKAAIEIGDTFVRGEFLALQPEESISEPGSSILPNRRYIQTYFGCKEVICSVVAAYAPLRGVKNIC